MSIDYRFNEWMVSGEKATVWTEKAYKLARIEVGRVSGMTIGAVLYLHYVKGRTAGEIRKHSVSNGLGISTVRAILRGFGDRASQATKEAYSIFMDMLENEPEMLDVLFEAY
ncbi:hypothetical protein [Parageobacillus thermoglucosidasius]|uniref:hypothetical protein n=1 Tax=Parageobacillus thermoglucosidasius TaxID=1426 RepID=UPI0027E754C6|nr:hypothetical protein PthstB1num2_26810 [Parageobacillus thermoglucosidasius]